MAGNTARARAESAPGSVIAESRMAKSKTRQPGIVSVAGKKAMKEEICVLGLKNLTDCLYQAGCRYFNREIRMCQYKAIKESERKERVSENFDYERKQRLRPGLNYCAILKYTVLIQNY